MKKVKAINNPVPPSVNISIERAAAVAMFAVFAVILFLFTLREPYHYDTVLYMKTVDAFRESSRLQCF